MKKHLSTLMICGALLLSASVAVQAQPQDYDHHGQDNHGHDKGHDNGHHGHGMYERGRSEGWYKRGGHVPAQYRGGSYVVTDWRTRHLRQPPRGYHYVRSDNGDFLLVAITTGVIASILANH
jgi:Ni/Co efflux regulator RcnB